MANTGHVSVMSLPLGWLGIRTDVELVTKVSDANRCELGAYEPEYPVRSDSGGRTSEYRISVLVRSGHLWWSSPCAHC
jgi:hypothetical protein